MKRQVLVVSHADADGHVIAEQVRRNLEATGVFDVSTVVDPARTAGHKAWLGLDGIGEIEACDIVFFVDLMFAPASFAAEADALVNFACAHPAKRFFVFDHHPLPFHRLSRASNLRAVYKPDVFDCTIGEPSWMMVIAALCEKQPSRVKKKKTDRDDAIAKGLKRAAAPGGPLPGEKLSALLRTNRWDDFERLGQEPTADHPIPRGHRKAGHPLSHALAELDRTATELLKTSALRHPQPRTPMSYDFDAVTDREPPTVTTSAPKAPDLEAIVTLLELAAIYLTPSPGTEFTLEQLLGQARDLGGADAVIAESDAKIVLDKAAFLKKTGKTFRLK